MHFAATKGKANFVRILLNHNADVNAEDQVYLIRPKALVVFLACSFQLQYLLIGDFSRITGLLCCVLPKRATSRSFRSCLIEMPTKNTEMWYD